MQLKSNSINMYIFVYKQSLKIYFIYIYTVIKKKTNLFVTSFGSNIRQRHQQ